MRLWPCAFSFSPAQLVVLADIGAERDDFGLIGVLDPGQQDGGVETTGVGENNLFHVTGRGDCHGLQRISTGIACPRFCMSSKSRPDKCWELFFDAPMKSLLLPTALLLLTTSLLVAAPDLVGGSRYKFFGPNNATVTFGCGYIKNTSSENATGTIMARLGSAVPPYSGGDARRSSVGQLQTGAAGRWHAVFQAQPHREIAPCPDHDENPTTW